jgi:Mrp family chromosome partitioning ATPase
LTTAATVAGFSVTLMSLEDFSDLPLPGGRVVQKDVDLSITENAARYDVVIVHAPSLLDTQFAVRVAQAAAGTVLALASGRKITPEDERAAELLRLVDAKFLGVVTTPPRPVAVKAVRKKAPRSEPSAAAARVKSSAP